MYLYHDVWVVCLMLSGEYTTKTTMELLIHAGILLCMQLSPQICFGSVMTKER